MRKQLNFYPLHCLVILLFLAATNLSGQELNHKDIIIKGVTKNKLNGKTLSYVNLGVAGTSLGTASDYRGMFELVIPGIYKDFDLHISAIGFQTQTYKLNTIPSDSVLEISLIPTLYKLNEVDVNAESRILYGILKEASNKVPENYVSTPYIYTFDYKSKMASGTAAKEFNSKGELYDSVGYHRHGYEMAMKSRTYTFNQPKDVEQNVHSFYNGITIMDELLNFDIARSPGNVLDVEHIDKYNLSLRATTTFRDDSVYVIGYKNLQPSVTSTGDYYVKSYEGEIYISKTSKAVLKNTTRVTSEKTSLYGRSFAIAPGKQPAGSNLSYEFTTTYQPNNGRYILSTVSFISAYTTANKRQASYNADLIVENFKQKPAIKVKSRDLFKRKK